MEPRISIITLGVADLERSFQFYHDGLGFPTTKTPEDGIIFFQTGGTCLALYPADKLAEDVGPDIPAADIRLPSITLAHNTREKDQVNQILLLAEQAGGKIEKPAADTFWGGYGGYFSDPDGYLWEVAFADFWKFNADGSLVIE
ncbi:MAG: VOC family protein [Chloroflexota bacterium]